MVASPHPWTVKFSTWVASIGGRIAAAYKLGRSVASVHAWLHGTLPRRKNLAHIEKRSRGGVPAALAAEPDHEAA